MPPTLKTLLISSALILAPCFCFAQPDGILASGPNALVISGADSGTNSPTGGGSNWCASRQGYCHLVIPGDGGNGGGVIDGNAPNQKATVTVTCPGTSKAYPPTISFTVFPGDEQADKLLCNGVVVLINIKDGNP
jgi:hypothetical protein